ncbi:hypothetical protein C7455_103123 [Roseicyclus mahoneyensis]|uniref:DUF2946 family protein n=1 Tax=Roseicyclus mahoneyensis TaxID=164332 RepID=A0A316GK42_9RHOB|nr:hypothetical protein C7455_103123 [Roseicyclus mahoneyensis]
MVCLRALVLPPLLLLLVITGIGIGSARGAMAADGQLCSVTGPAPVVIAHDGLPLFDTDGAPVTLDRSVCLDCLIATFALPPASAGAAAPEGAQAAPFVLLISDWIPGRACPGGLARAPPLAA